MRDQTALLEHTETKGGRIRNIFESSLKEAIPSSIIADTDV